MTHMPKEIWISMLAKMVAPMDAAHAVGAISAMVPMLTLPPDAFTAESVRAVCSTGRQLSAHEFGPLTRVPTFGELETALGRWWAKKVELELLRGAPTPRARLAAPPQENGPTEEAVQYVADKVRAFQSERSFQSPTDKPKARIKPLHLSDGHLALEYKRLGIRNPRTPV